jgi:hypothetical protein
VQEVARIDKQDCIKLKSFCPAKENFTKVMTDYRMEDIFASSSSDRD